MTGYLDIGRYLQLAAIALRTEDEDDEVSAIRLMCRKLREKSEGCNCNCEGKSAA
jgi:hypothetical protein